MNNEINVYYLALDDRIIKDSSSAYLFLCYLKEKGNIFESPSP